MSGRRCNEAFGAVMNYLDKPGVYGAFGCHPLSAAEWDDDMARVVSLFSLNVFLFCFFCFFLAPRLLYVIHAVTRKYF